jgi:hypothetical protein
MNMHADEESDEGVVPMKRPNKEGLPSAEAVEGRTSPKGNGGQATVVRTQRRVPTSNGLAAVRQKTCGSTRCCITSPSTA